MNNLDGSPVGQGGGGGVRAGSFVVFLDKCSLQWEFVDTTSDEV